MPEFHEAHVKEFELDREKKTRVFLTELKSKNEKLYPVVLEIAQGKIEDSLGIGGLVEQIESWVDQVTKAHLFLQDYGFGDFLDHDSNSKDAGMMGNLNLLRLHFQAGRIEKAQEKAGIFLSEWDRYWVVLEDLLLRRISPDKIEEENIGELDIDMFERLVGFFESQELVSLKDNNSKKDPVYQNLENKNFVNEIDFEELKKKLEGKKIKGNNGLTYNFVFNALRNALKDRIEAENVYLDSYVDGNQLVISIMDDGRGIDREALDPESDDFIHKKGTSRTNSTGMGLANFGKRIKSAGGDEIVLFGRKGDEDVNVFRSSGIILNPEIILGNINRKRRKQEKGEINTIFEIRLPLEDIK